MFRTIGLVAAAVMAAAGWTGAAFAADGETTGSRILIVYFSHTGTTKEIAERLQQKLGAAIHRIEPATAYPTDRQALFEQAQKEVDEDVQPELKGEWPDLKDFDLVLVGGPVWFGSLAPPVLSFLAKADLEKKFVAPFCTFGGSLGTYFEDFEAAVPGGTPAVHSGGTFWPTNAKVAVLNGLALGKTVIANEEDLEKAIDDWAAKLPQK